MKQKKRELAHGKKCFSFFLVKTCAENRLFVLIFALELENISIDKIASTKLKKIKS